MLPATANLAVYPGTRTVRRCLLKRRLAVDVLLRDKVVTGLEIRGGREKEKLLGLLDNDFGISRLHGEQLPTAALAARTDGSSPPARGTAAL